jgi:hypothetical protein
MAEGPIERPNVTTIRPTTTGSKSKSQCRILGAVVRTVVTAVRHNGSWQCMTVAWVVPAVAKARTGQSPGASSIRRKRGFKTGWPEPFKSVRGAVVALQRRSVHRARRSPGSPFHTMVATPLPLAMRTWVYRPEPGPSSTCSSPPPRSFHALGGGGGARSTALAVAAATMAAQRSNTITKAARTESSHRVHIWKLQQQQQRRVHCLRGLIRRVLGQRSS